ncbi:MAG: sugar ABC transporter ATP-binding protein [Spirochaetales bacterium]|nr:sugar ABC transporter ATP-binding protein [Spirochaetales bacterium]
MRVPFLRMKEIGKRFPGVQALQDVTFDAFQGEAIALLGANGAGKSTLMNVLGGIISPDEGVIQINGKTINIKTPKDASEIGIAFVHQEMALLPTMTVMDNMFISDYPVSMKIKINRAIMRKQCSEVLDLLGCRISPENYIRDLGTGDRQMVEIGRALLGQNKIFIFDEPTSSLSKREKLNLVRVIQKLKDEGMTVIYITHFLNEVYEICERVSVLRSGQVVGGGTIEEVQMINLVRLMVGEVKIEDRGTERITSVDNPIMEVSSLTRKGVYKDINFTLHKGEILGFWGLLGSGRTEVARGVVGLDPVDSVKMKISKNGELQPATPDTVRRQIGMVTEERRVDGLFLPMSVKRNMSMANLNNLIKKNSSVIDKSKENLLCDEFVDRLNIQISDKEQIVETLSGGNQQKVILGRWLEVNPSILIMDEPTRGLDVSAKAEIARIIVRIAKEGTSIILISSEIDEMMSLCDRFLVFNKGKIIADLAYGVSEDKLVGLAAGADEVIQEGDNE